MNYRKLIDATLSNHQDKGLTAFAGIIGLATGAAIAVLFAPDSGKRSRNKLSTAVLGLFRQKNTATTAGSDDQHITDLRESVREHASHLEGS
jgi:gas vesicle protein